MIDVALKAYAFNAHRAPPTAYSMRAKCNTTIPVADVHIQAPDFIKARGTNSSPKAHNHIRLSNRRNHQVMPLKNDQHCIRVSAAQKQPVQSCFKLNVTRKLFHTECLAISSGNSFEHARLHNLNHADSHRHHMPVSCILLRFAVTHKFSHSSLYFTCPQDL